jgi:hypothetical protein
MKELFNVYGFTKVVSLRLDLMLIFLLGTAGGPPAASALARVVLPPSSLSNESVRARRTRLQAGCLRSQIKAGRSALGTRVMR